MKMKTTTTVVAKRPARLTYGEQVRLPLGGTAYFLSLSHAAMGSGILVFDELERHEFGGVSWLQPGTVRHIPCTLNDWFDVTGEVLA
jgi:hypothetical protein